MPSVATVMQLQRQAAVRSAWTPHSNVRTLVLLLMDPATEPQRQVATFVAATMQLAKVPAAVCSARTPHSDLRTPVNGRKLHLQSQRLVQLSVIMAAAHSA